MYNTDATWSSSKVQVAVTVSPSWMGTNQENADQFMVRGTHRWQIMEHHEMLDARQIGSIHKVHVAVEWHPGVCQTHILLSYIKNIWKNISTNVDTCIQEFNIKNIRHIKSKYITNTFAKANWWDQNSKLSMHKT